MVERFFGPRLDMMNLRALLRFGVAVFTVATVVYALRSRRDTGQFLGVPYDFRKPTMQRFRLSLWNPDEDRVFTPSFFGVGWSVNFHRVLNQLRDYRPPRGEPNQSDGQDS